MKKARIENIKLGCDPEFFIENNDGQIVASEECIPENGVKGSREGFTGKVIRDGVQVEINPSAQSCRQQLGYCIAASLKALENSLKDGMSVSKKAVIAVPKNYLDSLSPAARALGCAPSQNTHNSIAITETQKSTNTRSAGGHIHLGIQLKSFDPVELVTMLDQFVGNTSVLLDRDPEQKTRRKLYGRAGEYRLPPHGLEYRTPSNYWMISFPMASFITGLARQTCAFMAKKHHQSKEQEIQFWTEQRNKYCHDTPSRDAYQNKIEELISEKHYQIFKEDYDEMSKWALSLINKEKLQTAINENDFDLAMENHAITEQIIAELFEHTCPEDLSENDHVPVLTAPCFEPFRFFIEKGLNHWFPDNMLNNWRKFLTSSTVNEGWEAWFYNTVIPQWKKSKKTKSSQI